MKLHDELHELYELISMLVIVAKKRGLQMIDWEKTFWRHGNEFTAYEDYLEEGEQEEN